VRQHLDWTAAEFACRSPGRAGIAPFTMKKPSVIMNINARELTKRGPDGG
jgi:hypothetical protein